MRPNSGPQESRHLTLRSEARAATFFFKYYTFNEGTVATLRQDGDTRVRNHHADRDTGGTTLAKHSRPMQPSKLLRASVERNDSKSTV